MPQSKFFIRKSDSKGTKRKKTGKNIPNKSKKKNEKPNPMQENISSDEESISGNEKGYPEDFSSDEETEQEKKLRLTKKYLAQIEREEQDKNVGDDTKAAVAQRLKDEVLEDAGRLQKKKAHEYENIVPEVAHVFKGHNLSVTCVVVSSTEKFFFSGSKDCSIIKWSIEEKKKLKIVQGGKKQSSSGHGQILALALSSDDKFLASGCSNKIINIWNPDTMELLKTFRGHKDAISGLVFEKNSHQLISASNDRSLKLWNLDEMGYVETLFGHQDAITGVDCFLGEIALTSGGRDNTVRIWKIVEESQLVFQGYGASIDCVCVSSYQSFVSGGDDGTLLFWGTQKKKPMSKVLQAHGSDPESEEPNWIITLCSLQNTDLLASGSKDGFIRLWRRDDDSHTLVPISRIPVSGFVNTMQFTPSGSYLIAGVGQEHKLGRWWKIKESKNSIVLFSWKNKS
ncbi:hypothetical protein JTE90_000526 [Oedothorax gibbosus]|uniref:U3 small nucleolar RNA-interacting protein 2 n=1 Tax=Oedothorax gibbosus TaxID=931172 RepID=A0AAV6VUM8_9ARAC|nr:hypothetical protein JTE90_000526 [Oedothorax gibbosus]